MKNAGVTAVPASYRRAVRKELQGSVHEVSYPVSHYINASRQLVTDRKADPEEAGRETVRANAITKACNLYLPPGYDAKDMDARYNVLYLLHGVGGDHNEWLFGNGNSDGRYLLCNLFDNLIANGDIDPLIIVFPNGRSAHDWSDRAFRPPGTNMLGFYYFDYELRYDLIPYIESKYPTCANIMDTSSEGIQYNRMHRAIAGLSMGGMQALNLILGGFRCDSAEYAETESPWQNGLAETVQAPGMSDLFAYVGAFSNAPTSSAGKALGTRMALCGHRLHLLYTTCGDADEVAIHSYRASIEGLADSAKEVLGDYYQILIKDGLHDFDVWNNGVYNFIRLAFRKGGEQLQSRIFQTELTLQP
ncbi:alpha/beta hydrolase [Cohnella luojiensis]|uniref:Esterase n=1 Tax=Cohnella luojiensis TaxID=652876 RepID=A0A4Y8LYT2_9BACL|nr:alpha/beta hydrolase-fold protein [Cohnella luojiensis]TFE27488.1 esterase [Cohnella luojiensis]